jgi:hypothetical protein
MPSVQRLPRPNSTVGGASAAIPGLDLISLRMQGCQAFSQGAAFWME